MMQRIRSFIPRVPRETWGLRLIAVMLSVLLWALAPRTPVTETTTVGTGWSELPVLSVIDGVQTASYPVQVAALGLPAGSSIEIRIPEPSRVTVNGRASTLQRVAEVVAMLHLRSEDGVQTGDVPVHALDANGQVVSDVTVTPNRVTVRIVVTSTDQAAEAATAHRSEAVELHDT